MRLLDRYLLRELFIWLGFVLGGLLLCVIAFDLIGSLNRFQEAHLQPRDVFDLYLAQIPGWLVFLLPVVLLIALLWVVTTHARHNELTAIRAAGISLWRICLPYFAVAFLMSLAVFAMNELWVPDAQARIARIMKRHSSGVVDPNVAYNLGFPNVRDGRNWLIGAYNFKTDVGTNPNVAWREEGSEWQLSASRLERVNGVWTFFGNTTIGTSDIVNLDSLAPKLKRQTATNGVSQYISSQLSMETETLLEYYRGGPNPDLQRSLAADLDHLVHQEKLYDSQRFAGIKLSPDTESLLAQKPEGVGLVELNLLLLMDAYPHELARNNLNTVRVYKGEAANNYQRHPYLNTNMLAMPQFTETPREFANEAKFNGRFQKMTASSAEVPIAELIDYEKWHPNLTKERASWLRTQLHARVAMPWQCIVVVLIAIPFGAASGRRNVFKGVASSLVICFAYFVVFKLGLALGFAGILPGWAAAWLPNAIFGLAGFWLILRVR